MHSLAPQNKFTIKNLIKANKTDEIPKNKQSGIYQINCADCDEMYIGQTKRNNSIRAAEHMRNVKNLGIEKSTIAPYVWNNNHRINKEPKLLK